MFDRFNRKITYLRISLTDRCNLKCTYCVPSEGMKLMKAKEMLSDDELIETIKIGAELGITKIRFTGGEPLMRANIVNLTSRVKNIPGIQEVVLTTNGIFLAKMAADLKQAGLDRVNISLDTLNPQKYKEITRGGNIYDVFAGIHEAKKVGLTPVKINFVRIPGVNEAEEEPIREYCKENDLKLRFIKQMNLETGEFSQVEGGDGGNCALCNRLRLTANGTIKPCLHGNFGYNIREHGIKEAFMLALHIKPEKGTGSTSHSFYNIGG